MSTKRLRRVIRSSVVLAVACATLTAGARAELVERVVAVVGEQPILLSEILVQLQVAVQSLGIDPGDSARVAQLRDQIREQQIDQRVLALEARRQELKVNEEELQRTVKSAIERNRAEIGSEELFQMQLEREGLTEEDLRRRYEKQARLEMTASMLIQRQVQRDIAVTPEDVRAYYDEHRSELPPREARLHLLHLMVAVRPDSLLLHKARELAADVAAQIRAGTISFADAARRYSDDPNGRQGGDLHTIRRGDFRDRLGGTFEEAVFALEPDEVSEPLESPLGYHLVTVSGKDAAGTSVRASHILFGVPRVQADQARAQERAERLHARILAGESFEDLARRYSDDLESRPAGGDLGWLPAAALGDDVRGVIDPLPVGGLSAPVAGEGAYHLFKVLGREDEREYSFAEIREELTEWVRNQKLEGRYRAYVDELKARTYIERRAWSED